jgi:uncharacterized protein DUF1942
MIISKRGGTSLRFRADRGESTFVKSAVKSSLAVVAALGVASAVWPSPACADDAAVVHPLGTQVELVNGDVVQGWTIRDLKPTADAIPYAVSGTLWEATASDTAIHGSAIPVVSNLNARARNGDTYPVLFGVATPQGVNPATLGQGQTTAGKVYFDVTGSAPDSVTYSAGGSDLIVWVQAPPAPAATRPGSSQGSHPAPAPPPGGTAAAGPSAAPTANGVPAAAGQGAPILPPGTAVPGSVGTPLPVGTPSAPLPTGVAPAPSTGAGSVGTPLPPNDTPSAPVPVTLNPPTPVTTAVPQPAAATGQPGSIGTQVPAGSQPTLPAVPTTTVAPAP